MAGYEIQKLAGRHHEILQLALAGNSRKDIAGVLGMTPEAITLITKAPIFQEAFAREKKRRDAGEAEASAEVSQRARGVLEKASVEAAETQAGLLSEEYDPKTRLAASQSILDRVLGKAAGGGDGSGGTVQITAQSVQLLQLAMSESRGQREVVAASG
jgi:hypothetical protein